MLLTRRSLIGALFAPAVIRVADLMPIKALAVEPAPLLQFHALPPGIYSMVVTDFRVIEDKVVAKYLIKSAILGDDSSVILRGTRVKEEFSKNEHLGQYLDLAFQAGVGVVMSTEIPGVPTASQHPPGGRTYQLPKGTTYGRWAR